MKEALRSTKIGEANVLNERLKKRMWLFAEKRICCRLIYLPQLIYLTYLFAISRQAGSHAPLSSSLTML